MQYQVNYRFGDENFVSEKVSRPDFEIMNSRKGTYDIQVFSYNVLDQLSATSTNITFEAVGKTAVPQDVTGLLVETISDQLVRLRFNQATDIDVLHGGNVVVRHSNLTDGTGTFTNSVDLIPALPGNVSESSSVWSLIATKSIKLSWRTNFSIITRNCNWGVISNL